MQKLIETYCQQLIGQGLKRERFVFQIKKNALYFNSNDYLGLTQSKAVRKAFKQGFEKYPSGSGGSMVVCGYHPIHNKLEKSFAQHLDADDALLFASGYTANLGVVSLLARMQAHLYVDKGIHASFYDGIQLNRAAFTRFLHNQVDDLTKKLATPDPHSVVITEGIFSMSGQIAPLSHIHTLCHEMNASLIVDEAHAFGILGKNGLGAANHHQLTQHDVPLRIIPFGKAMGSQGAIVVGQKIWIEALLQLARPYIYSTAISPALAYGLLETFQILQSAEEKRKTLFEIIAYFNQAVVSSSLSWRPSVTPIQQLQLSCPHKALFYAQQLSNAGIFCSPMREPTVSKADTGLRIILNSNHEPHDIDYLFKQLHRIDESQH